MEDIELTVGDYVQLLPRRAPHVDQRDWWWQVTRVHEYAFDAFYGRRSADRGMTSERATRIGVSFVAITAHRKPSP